MSNQARSEEERTTILMALVAWAGNASKASRYLKSEKGIAVSSATLSDWKVRYGERYDELREKHRDQMETRLANEMREVAALAVETERLAVDEARKRLKAGDDQDPGRTAANLARVAQSSTDKLMTLTSRPVSITENRDATALMRSLIQRGVLIAPEEEPKELPEGVDAP